MVSLEYFSLLDLIMVYVAAFAGMGTAYGLHSKYNKLNPKPEQIVLGYAHESFFDGNRWVDNEEYGETYLTVVAEPRDELDLPVKVYVYIDGERLK